MFKIFADQCIHADLIKALRTANFQVISAKEVSLDKASDQKIFDYVKAGDFVLLSFDKDFGNFFRFTPLDTHGIVIIYIEKMSKTQIIKETIQFFKKATVKSLSGKLFIVESGRIRPSKR